jgi:hypothetical protein
MAIEGFNFLRVTNLRGYPWSTHKRNFFIACIAAFRFTPIFLTHSGGGGRGGHTPYNGSTYALISELIIFELIFIEFEVRRQ